VVNVLSFFIQITAVLFRHGRGETFYIENQGPARHIEGADRAITLCTLTRYDLFAGTTHKRGFLRATCHYRNGYSPISDIQMNERTKPGTVPL
jgi:hypothetical protein